MVVGLSSSRRRRHRPRSSRVQRPSTRSYCPQGGSVQGEGSGLTVSGRPAVVSASVARSLKEHGTSAVQQPCAHAGVPHVLARDDDVVAPLPLEDELGAHLHRDLLRSLRQCAPEKRAGHSDHTLGRRGLEVGGAG
eukprot:scaffold9499_cov55-Phaeocystis_antarctica.AAC.5